MTEPHGSVPVSSPEISVNKELPGWLYDQRVSLGFTSRQAGKFFLLGVDTNRKLHLVDRNFDSVAGIASAGNSLFVSTLSRVWHLNNGLLPGQVSQGHDRVYLPRTAYVTGDCAIHDMALDGKNRLVFANTRFSCLSVLSPSHSFRPVWKPDFISSLVPEDRCHLNGLAMAPDGRVSHVTACGVSDTRSGWRDSRLDGGVLIDADTRKVVLEGLFIPNSPRVYDNRIWLLNSGRGQVGFLEPGTGRFHVVARCPGFLRGLVFLNHYAIVTVSIPRGDVSIPDPPPGDPGEKERKASRSAQACGILVIDIHTGKIAHKMQIRSGVKEITGLSLIKDCRHPLMMGPDKKAMRNVFSIESDNPPKRPGKMKNPILV